MTAFNGPIVLLCIAAGLTILSCLAVWRNGNNDNL